MIGRDLSPRLRDEPPELTVACPECGGRAGAEASPVTIWRSGLTRRVQFVTCKNGCRQPGRRQGTVPARFEIEIPKEGTMTQIQELQESEREKVMLAISVAGYAESALAKELRLGPALYRWLRTGKGLGDAKTQLVVDWAETTLALASGDDLVRKVDAEGDEAELATQPCKEAAVVEALPPAAPSLSPADVMIQAVALRGALMALNECKLEIPAGAQLTVALNWCA